MQTLSNRVDTSDFYYSLIKKYWNEDVCQSRKNQLADYEVEEMDNALVEVEEIFDSEVIDFFLLRERFTRLERLSVQLYKKLLRLEEQE